MAHGGRAGGRWGGGNKRCTGSPFFGSLKNLTTGLIWLVTRVGGWGEAWGGGPWRAGKGGDGGGHQRAVWEQQQVHWFPFFERVAQGGDGGTRKLVTVAGGGGG